MLTLLRNGGVVSMSFLLLLGLVTMAASFHFAVRPRREVLGFLHGMGGAIVFATLAATAASLGATLYAATKVYEREGDGAGAVPKAMHLVTEGFAESSSAGILGFAMLTVTALLVAIGRRRLDAQNA